jgi:hypothetical protein
MSLHELPGWEPPPSAAPAPAARPPAPAGTDADYFLLAFARELGAALVSNDQVRDRSAQFAAVRRRVIRYMVVADEVVFEKRIARRRG